ncbi:MAG TPA: hypothetical protein VNU97_16175 [Rhizomicrobium sp.]|jgi:hypothetical protein|nr:hypothetical protein [Rhizomicrobium sp.]
MRSWLRLMPFLLAPLLLALAAPASAQGVVPLDDAAFTAYLQQKLQLYSAVPVTVAGPLGIDVAVAADNVVAISLHDLHDACVRTPAQCDAIVTGFVQNAARTVLSSAPPAAATITSAGSALVPADREAFMAYVAAKAAAALPGARIEIDAFDLAVTRPGGERLLLPQQGLFDACKLLSFRCSRSVDDYVGGMHAWLSLPSPEQMRAALQIAGPPFAAEPALAPFYRPAFANLAETCFKTADTGGVAPMTNADRRDLGLDLAAALALCERGTRSALGPLAPKLAAPPSGGIATLAGPFAASYALFAADWQDVAAASGGHLLIAVPSRDVLLYARSDGAADVAALAARARAVFAASDLGLSSDVYRWSARGWVLATAPGAMPAAGAP